MPHTPMSFVPPNGMPTFYGAPAYRDPLGAIDWLERVFGFRRLLVVPGEGERTVAHAEMAFGTGAIMIGSVPKEHLSTLIPFNAPYVFVADVRAHYDSVVSAGAEITRPYEEKDYGGAGYSVKDCEGNEWSFGNYVPAPAYPIHGAVPYLAVRRAAEAIEFYARAFGAVETGERYQEGDGRIGHAELSIGPVVLYLSDEHAEIDVLGPESRGGATSTIVLQAADTDAVVEQAVAAGATVDREPKDEPYGRMATITDPFGHRWMINGPAKG